MSTILILAALIALLPASIARGKGRSFLSWYIGGFLFWIIAFPASIIASDARPRCPECAETVQESARICPHCRSEITVSGEGQETARGHWRTVLLGILVLIVAVALVKHYR